MNVRGVLWILLVVSWSASCPAQTLGWQAGPVLRLASHATVVPLDDGRLLACPTLDPAAPCEIVDPLTAQRQAVVRPSGRVVDAVPLDGSRVLLRSGERLDVQSGVIETWPATPTHLAGSYAQALSNGRAVFWDGEGAAAGCGTLTFFLGGQRGFQAVRAAAPGSCVSGVFELGGEDVLVARRLGPDANSSRLDFDVVRLNLETWTWQRGPRLGPRRPSAAFRHGPGFAVLTAAPGALGRPVLEAAWVDGAGKLLTTTPVADVDWAFEARPFGADLMLLEARAVTVWRPSTGQLARIERHAPPLQGPWVVEREGKLLVIDREGHNATFVLVEAVASSTTACDVPFDYALNAVQSGRIHALEPSRLLELTSAQCSAWLDAGARLPAAITQPLTTLVARVSGPASPEEDAAARALCTLTPRIGSTPINQLARSTRLGAETRARCADAASLMPVLVAAHQGQGVANALSRAGFSNGASVQPWVVPLLASRPRLRTAAGPLLLAARERRAVGFDALRELLCLPVPDPALASACASTSADDEQRWRAEEHAEREAEWRGAILRNFGIATGIFGGLGALSYLDRQGAGGRAIAIGSGIAAGGVLAGFVTISAAKGGDTNGLGGILLAIPVTILGGIGGGLLTASTSSTPGDARFASAAAPLGGLWLFSAGIALDAW